MNLCRACSNNFRSVFAFDMHRTGGYGKALYNSKGKAIGHEKHTRRCFTTDEMLALGMLQDDKGTWRGPATPGSDRNFEDDEQEEDELEEEAIQR